MPVLRNAKEPLSLSKTSRNIITKLGYCDTHKKWNLIRGNMLIIRFGVPAQCKAHRPCQM